MLLHILWGGMIIDEADVNDIPFDTNYADAIVNYLIPINILLVLLLINLFHFKSHISLKFFIVSTVTLVITSYLFFGIPIDVFYIIPIWFLISFITIKEKKSSYIESNKASVSSDEFFFLAYHKSLNNIQRNIAFEVFIFSFCKVSERQDLNLRPPQPHCGHMASISLQLIFLY